MFKWLKYQTWPKRLEVAEEAQNLGDYCWIKNLALKRSKYLIVHLCPFAV